MIRLNKRAAALLGLALIGSAATVAGVALSGESVPSAVPDTAASAASVPPAASGLVLSRHQRDAAGIVVSPAVRKTLSGMMSFPGEVQTNRYRSSLVSSRIPAVIQARQAVLGQSVRQGQPLVTLFSVEVADAQAQFLLADREWRRVQELGRDIVAGKRWIEAEVGREQARARLLTYGLSAGQVESLARDGRNRTPGTFTLAAPQSGTLVADSFRVGEMVEAGRPLFEVADTTTVWVEARLDPGRAGALAVGSAVTVRLGAVRGRGVVTQILPALDEHTRTQGVRLEVPNPDRAFHPGQFVQVELDPGASPSGIVLPTDAVLRDPEGGWTVFVEQADGSFAPVPVRVVENANGQTLIDGLAEGTRTVIGGAFFLQSERVKTTTGFAE